MKNIKQAQGKRGAMNLQRLLIINAVAMLAAGVVLFLWPELVPGVAGIELPRSAFFLCYLLGSSELALATLCFLAVKISDTAALRAIVITQLASYHLG